MIRCEQLEGRMLLAFMPVNVIGPGFLVPDAPRAHRHPAQVAATTSAATAGSLAAPGSVSATPVGATGLNVSWSPVAGAAVYRVSYTPGAYVPGPNGQKKIIDVPATSTTLSLSNLRPFTLYSLDVSAVPMTGPGTSTRLTAWTAKPATTQRFLYTFHLPKDRQGFQDLEPHIEVYDIENGHQWVKNIPLPSGIYNVRGVAASAQTDRVFVSFFDQFKDGYQPGGLLCMDLRTNAVVWQRKYDPAVVGSPDRFALTPDGQKLYVPTGENGGSDRWVVIDANTGNPVGVIHHATAAHNTTVSVDGRYVFMEGQEKSPTQASPKHTVAVVDTRTDRIVRRVGPFSGVVRPFTVNGKGSLVFATVHNLIGFQVGDVATGKVLYTAKPTGYAQPPADNRIHSHGIALTPDEKEVYVVDNDNRGLHVFDISNVPAGPPVYIGHITTRATGKNLQNQVDPAASNDATGVPAWVDASYDGKYVYAESGEVIDVASHTIIGQLRAKEQDSSGNLVWGPYSHSRFMLEIDFDGGDVVNVTDQASVGRVR
jgi:DNA-binding beta-propeller fold protein YncE